MDSSIFNYERNKKYENKAYQIRYQNRQGDCCRSNGCYKSECKFDLRIHLSPAQASEGRQETPQVLIMEFFDMLSRRIGDSLVRSDVVKAEDAEIYIYGINQILVSVVNVLSALIIGLIFGVFFEIAVLMAAYIPLRSFAGGFHAKTPLRCYIFSIIMLIVVSIGLKYLSIAAWAYYAVLAVSFVIVLVLSPIEDRNKPLDELEYKVYKRRAVIIAAIELLISGLLKLAGLNSLFIAVVYSFAALDFMLVLGMVKNHRDKDKSSK